MIVLNNKLSTAHISEDGERTYCGLECAGWPVDNSGANRQAAECDDCAPLETWQFERCATMARAGGLEIVFTTAQRRFSQNVTTCHLTLDNIRTICGLPCEGWYKDEEGTAVGTGECSSCGSSDEFKGARRGLRELTEQRRRAAIGPPEELGSTEELDGLIVDINRLAAHGETGRPMLQPPLSLPRQLYVVMERLPMGGESYTDVSVGAAYELGAAKAHLRRCVHSAAILSWLEDRGHFYAVKQIRGWVADLHPYYIQTVNMVDPVIYSEEPQNA